MQLRSHKALDQVREYLSNIAKQAEALLTDLPEGSAKEALRNVIYVLINRST
jgi:geranylgeranyl pyrophosphate synthase